MLKKSSLASAVAIAILFLVAPASQAQAVAQFDLPAQSLAASLRAIGSQTSTNVLFDPPLVEGMNAPGMAGEFTVEEAFKKLLAGTGLKYRFLDDKTVVVISASAAGASTVQEIVVVTGTRRTDRTVADSAVPVDVFTAENVRRQGFSDTNDILRTLVPSFNVTRNPQQDSSSLVRTPNLRGFAPDQALVLVNNKRRHRSAVLHLLGDARSFGSQGPDLGTIPAAAISRVEVLRDGASAQYGSDAIAGVINFQLDDSRDGIVLGTRFGRHYAADGEELLVYANAGLPLGATGFLNLSGEFTDAAATQRGAQAAAAQALIDLGAPYDTTVPVPSFRHGNPDSRSMSLFANSGFDLTDGLRAYAFGNYRKGEVEGDFFWRHPLENEIFLPTVPLEGGTTFNFRELLPGGFTPRFGGEAEDASLVAGVKGEAASGLSSDFSVNFGRSEMNYTVHDSINPSMGPDSPRSFHAGANVEEDLAVNLDFVYPWQVSGLSRPVNLAAGLEWRREAYEIVAGDEDSYRIGPYAQFLDAITGEVANLPVGSNGFQGFRPTDAGRFTRENYAVYADVDADLTSRLSAGVAARFEDFSDFGSTFNWKGVMRFELNKRAALRASVNTGFRAPTGGQLFTTNVGTYFFDGGPIVAGVYPVESEVSKYFGAKPLKPEESFGIAGGLVLRPKEELLITLDYYDVKVENRLGLSNYILVTEEDREVMLDLGVPGAAEIAYLNYFTSGFDTRTRGVDLVATYERRALAGTLSLTAAINYNDTKVTKFDDSVAGWRKQGLEGGLPRTRSILSAGYERDRFSVLARGSYYGSYVSEKHYGDEVLVDLEMSYRPTRSLEFSVGAQNLFDEYPDKLPDTSFGAVYGSSPIGFNGGFYYSRFTVSY